MVVILPSKLSSKLSYKFPIFSYHFSIYIVMYHSPHFIKIIISFLFVDWSFWTSFCTSKLWWKFL